MVFGTPNDRYNADAASALLHEFGEQTVAIAKKNLLARGVLSKLVRDPNVAATYLNPLVEGVEKIAKGAAFPEVIIRWRKPKPLDH